MKNFEFLFAAYAVIWILLGWYFFRLNNKLNQISHRLDQLEAQKVDKSKN